MANDINGSNGAKDQPGAQAPVTTAGNGDRLAESVVSEQKPRLSFPVVGIGASAGGLEAYTEFLQHCRADSGMAFVLVQHLSPKHTSMMAELLGKHTQMPVQQVEDSLLVEPNHVYVIRPGATMTIHQGRLHLGKSAAEPMNRRPVDDFFRSLAEEQRERAIAVILSGTGSNGTMGAESIKAVGGFCIAQDPESCKFAGMPRSLIESNLADAILQPSEMFEVIARYASHAYVTGQEQPPETVASIERQAMNEIVAVLRTRTRHDFSVYKKPTLVRRIQRRMTLLQIEQMGDYVKALWQSPGEVTALADDLMIHITGFFRDTEVWQSLNEQVIKPLVAEKPEDSSIRCWVTACSSGEEAYTIGMLLLEAAHEAGKHFDIKIFATDTAERSLVQARAGIFPGGIESEIAPDRLHRFFEKDDSFYRVRKELRELVVFAPQNVLQDPPFSRLDLCTCRNLLIYIEGETQRRILTMLHFGLRENGVLLLGNSETISGAEDLFEPIDKRHRIFRRIGGTRTGVVDFPIAHLNASRRLLPTPGISEESVRSISRGTIGHLATRALLEEHTPAAVVVDRGGNIVYYHGKTERFLQQPSGEPTRELLKMAREDVRGTIRAAFNHAITHTEPVRMRDGFLNDGEKRQRLEITASPLMDGDTAPYFLISFQTHLEPPPTAADPVDRRVESEIGQELKRVRDELQSTIEELQTSNEEMKASHEEVTSVNEELQSSNEELETSKEELQSLNEELATVNAQLQAKVEEVERSGNDLASLLTSTDIAVIFLDPRFRIRRFTTPARQLIDLITGDIGRPLADLTRKFEDPHLFVDAESVLEKLTPIEREIVTVEGRIFSRRVLPYRTMDNRIDGIVITFIDITQSRQNQTKLVASEERLLALLQAGSDMLYRMSPDWSEMRQLQGKGGFADTSAPTDQWMERYIPIADREKVRQAIRDAVANRNLFELEHHVLRDDGTTALVFSRAIPQFNEQGELLEWVGSAKEITQGRAAEEAALAAKETAEAANRIKDEFLATLSHELRTPLSVVLLWTKMLASGTPAAANWRDGLEAIERSANSQKQLIDDLLDSQRITSGKLRLEMRQIALTSMVAEAVETIVPTVEAKQITIHTEFGTDVGEIIADPERLRQVIWNLLTNAVKFTQRGGRIDVRVRRSESDVIIDVKDNGRGISPDFLPLVFERFRQADPTMTRSVGGLGLGLSIVKQLIELHGGTVTAESAGVDQGATFTVQLPLTPRKTGHIRRTAAHQSGQNGSSPGLKGLSALVVEDEPGISDAISSLLVGCGMDVTTVATAGDALAAFKAQPPAILISDIGLPDLDGHSLMKQIRAFEKTSNASPVPSLALTAFVRSEDRRAARDAGYNQFIGKPFDPQRLLETVSLLIQG